MIRAFTGPSSLITPAQRIWACKAMFAYPIASDDVWRSGCANYIDTFAAWSAITLGVMLSLYVPAAPHNYDLVEIASAMAVDGARIYIHHCEAGPTSAGSYRIRNQQMIENADHLVAFVRQDTPYRSGEWMTINIANNAGIPVNMEVLPGGLQ